jgi:tRNA A58 N-methylase Trm61
MTWTAASSSFVLEAWAGSVFVSMFMAGAYQPVGMVVKPKNRAEPQ